ncbi:helix-turn-helix domain-containing protein [Streptomyces sp. NA02950]|uniref:helix-turn-helix domain-containing protein n=1 Tax=Streptomyces sp. NA02950 TaxID=2742137 RepID=UPI001C3776C9|nr:helix-turn-helix transcriptional regulator [Streptomyces sp. NA02950]
MSSHATNPARVIPLRPATAPPPATAPRETAPPGAAPKEPLWRHVVGGVLRRERRAQQRTLKDVADAARISMPYLSELERGRKEASSEVLAAAAHALGLGLADLLALAHDELARAVAPRARRRPLGAADARTRGGETEVTTPERDEVTTPTALAEPRARRTTTRTSAHRGEVRLAA